MKDPLGEMGYDTIFVIKGYNLNQLEMYENMAKLKNGTVKKTVTLPYKFAGTGAAVYGRYLFYSRYQHHHGLTHFNRLKSRFKVTYPTCVECFVCLALTLKDQK